MGLEVSAVGDGVVVLSYRVFFFDNVGDIERAEEFEAEDDDAALMAVEMLRKGPRMELWQRDRLVKRWT